MRRSVSMNTTATVLQVRLGRYQNAIITVNTLLLVVGLTMLFFGILLDSSYHMTRLYFISDWLFTFPTTVIVLGALIVLISIMGILSATSKNRYALLVYAFLMACMVIPQFFSTYAAIRAKEDTDEGAFTRIGNVEKFRKHILNAFTANDSAALDTWDMIQEDLRCCGDGSSGNVHGYRFWSKASGSLSDDLRMSCCVRTNGKIGHNCPYKDFFKADQARSFVGGDLGKNDIDAEIYRTGCLTVLDSIYHEEVIPLLQPVFLLVSIIVAVLEVALVALAVGYVAVLKRREEKYGYAGDNGHNDTAF